MRLAALTFAAAVAGCSGADVYYAPIGTPAPFVIKTVTVQTDTMIRPEEPGLGVGLFVDYAAGGAWRVQAICNVLDKRPCDYDPNAECEPPPCVWDVVATALSGPLDVRAGAIDSNDRILRANDGALRLGFETSTEIDSVQLTSDPGERLQLDVFLDGFYDASGVIWTNEAGILEKGGAPSNPVVFEPTSP
jgi:hypothetical protein